jgi:hypothetical protein
MSRKRSANMLRRGVRSAGAPERRGPVMTPMSPSADARLLDVNYRPADEGVRRMTEQEWLISVDPARMLSWLVGSDWADTSHEWNCRVSDRKLRLFACACCRHVWHLLTDKLSREIVEAAERFADGKITEAAFENAWLAHDDAPPPRSPYASLAHWVAPMMGNSIETAVTEHLRRLAVVAGRDYRPQQAALLRDIVGNPFRRVTLCPSRIEDRPGGDRVHIFECPDPEEGYHAVGCPITPTVLALATAAYQERPGRTCEECDGSATNGRGDGYGGLEDCPACRGTGHVEDGTLCNDRLTVLADALEDAGCTDETILTHLRSDGPHVRGCWCVDLILGRE